jgi:hypothetical protein
MNAGLKTYGADKPMAILGHLSGAYRLTSLNYVYLQAYLTT